MTFEMDQFIMRMVQRDTWYINTRNLVGSRKLSFHKFYFGLKANTRLIGVEKR